MDKNVREGPDFGPSLLGIKGKSDKSVFKRRTTFLFVKFSRYRNDAIMIQLKNRIKAAILEGA